MKIKNLIGIILIFLSNQIFSSEQNVKQKNKIDIFFNIAKQADVEEMEDFLKHNNEFDINVQNEIGQTALMFASARKKIDLIMLLLDYNSNVFTQDDAGTNAYLYAHRHKKVQNLLRDYVTQYLFYKKKIKDELNNARYKLIKETTDLMPDVLAIINNYAAEEPPLVFSKYIKLIQSLFDTIKLGNLEHLYELLQKFKLDVNSRNIKENVTNLKNYYDRNTALIYAVRYGHINIVEYLIKNKADLNAQDNRGDTALIYAVRNKRTDIVKLLLENGAKVDIKEFECNRTALHWACINNLKEIVELLLYYKANVNAQDRFGRTAINYAVNRNHEIDCYFDFLPVIKVLLDYNADMYITDNDGKSGYISFYEKYLKYKEENLKQSKGLKVKILKFSEWYDKENSICVIQ